MNDFTKRRNRRAETIMAIMVLGFWAVTATLSLAIPAAIVYALVAWARSL
jgi:hypothetical protein